jgi:hypothetical protein
MRSVAFELRKSIRRELYILAALAIFCGLIVSWATVRAADAIGIYDAQYQVMAVVGMGSGVGIPPVPLWIVATAPFLYWGSEYANDGYATSLLSVPSAKILVLAKWASAMLLGSILALVVTFAAYIGACAQSSAIPFSMPPPNVFAAFGWNALFVVCLSTLSFGLAYMIRSSVGSVSLFFLAAWAIEPMVEVVLTYASDSDYLTRIVPRLPFRAISDMQVVPGVGSSVAVLQLPRVDAAVEGVSLVVCVLGACLSIAHWRRREF